MGPLPFWAWGLGVLALPFVLWMVGGIVRAGAAAREWFTLRQGVNTVTEIAVEGVFPAVPRSKGSASGDRNP